MILLAAVQAASTSATPNIGAIVLTGGLIGIYAARRSYGKRSFRELRTGPIMLGAGFGTLLLTLLLLVAAIKTQEVSTGESFGRWLGWGIGGAILIGGPAALIARFSRPSKPENHDELS